MAATENFNVPNWTDPIDTNLDAMRDSLAFILLSIAKGSRIIPGWNTIVTTELSDYSRPSQVLFTKGKKQMRLTFTYDSNNDLAETITYCYNDGVSGAWTCLDPVHLFYEGGIFQRTYDVIGTALFTEGYDVDDTAGDGVWDWYGDLLDEGSNYATYTWDFDYTNEADIIGVYDSAISVAGTVPATATIYNVKVEIYAWATGSASPIIESPIYLSGVRAVGYDPDTAQYVNGTVQANVAVTTTPTLYTFEGDLDYWGLTNAQMMALFDGSGRGEIDLSGYCDDTSVLTGPLTLNVDYIKMGLSYR